MLASAARTHQSSSSKRFGEHRAGLEDRGGNAGILRTQKARPQNDTRNKTERLTRTATQKVRPQNDTRNKTERLTRTATQKRVLRMTGRHEQKQRVLDPRGTGQKQRKMCRAPSGYRVGTELAHKKKSVQAL
jgi:hypothetical protein